MYDLYNKNNNNNSIIRIWLLGFVCLLATPACYTLHTKSKMTSFRLQYNSSGSASILLRIVIITVIVKYFHIRIFIQTNRLDIWWSHSNQAPQLCRLASEMARHLCESNHKQCQVTGLTTFIIQTNKNELLLIIFNSVYTCLMFIQSCSMRTPALPNAGCYALWQGQKREHLHFDYIVLQVPYQPCNLHPLLTTLGQFQSWL